MPELPTASVLDRTAQRVCRRLFLLALWQSLTHVVPWCAVVGVLLLMLNLWLELALSASALAAGVLLLCILSAFLSAWLRPVAKFQALARWDAAAGRQETFASAWEMARIPHPTAGEQLHLAAALRHLPQCLPRLSRDLPFASGGWKVAVSSLVLLSAALFANFQQPQPNITPSSPDLVRRTQEGAQRLESAASKQLATLPGLNLDEKMALASLQDSLEHLAEDVEAKVGQSAEEVLATLETRASKAEKLARQLREDTESWASEKMLEELRRYSDTSPLAEAAKNRLAASVVEQAERFDSAVRGQAMSDPVVRRIQSCLLRLPEVAEKADAAKPLGRHLLAARQAFGQAKPDGAAREFAELAAHFRHLAERDEARKKLEQLAQEIRQAAGEAAQGKSQAPPGGQAFADKSLAKLPSGGKALTVAPSPAQAPDPDENGGANDSPEEAPMLQAPIPDELQAGDFDPDKPQLLLAGQGAAGQGQTSTGDAAGKGQNSSANMPEARQAAPREGHVEAVAGQSGPSKAEKVAAQPRAQNSLRSTPQLAADFVKAQEAALELESIPPARRQAVRRYFQALREQFAQSVQNP